MTANRFNAGFRTLLGSVSAMALTAGVAMAQNTQFAEQRVADLEANGAYLSGDYHNHTTCTDGSTSVTALVNESLVTYGLDWFAQTGHGGSGNRDCRFSDPEYDGPATGDGALWVDTIGQEGLKGDENDGRMWRWQNLQEYAYDMQKAAGELANKPAWLGVEHNAPGHEHVSMAIIQRQLRNRGDGYNTAQFEYLYDRGDADSSGGGDNDFENPANNGVAKVFDDAKTGLVGHQDAIRSVEWLRDNFKTQAYYVPAHVERQGGFVDDGNNGWNVEHFRDLHNAGLLGDDVEGPSIVFGAEMLAGHQFANGGRGTYEADRPTAGLGTYGGAGAYSGAEVSVAGFDFDGNPISNATLTTNRDELNGLFDGRLTEPSGSDQYDELDACSDCADPAPDGVSTSVQQRFVLGRPGVQTMWDALLGEGRRFFNFGNSDWHNRGAFGPFEPQSSLDAWPGEYQKVYAYTSGSDFGFTQEAAQEIVRGMRTGNSFSVMGDLIDSFNFVMCQGNRCATMGETLDVYPDRAPNIIWYMKLRDPDGANNSPYTFDNMSLAQIGMNVPTNEPVLSHVDVITGDITGEITPDQPEYETNVSNPTTEIFATIDALNGEFTVDGEFLVARGAIPTASITNDMYFRVRGTNMPKGTPNETDIDGNPLLDDYSSLVPCTAERAEPLEPITPVPADSAFNAANQIKAAFDGSVCPDHLPVDADGVKHLDADVEAWTDLWFYANPVFLNVRN